MARARETTTLKCSQCEEIVYKCYLCGEYFEAGDKIDCRLDGLRHVCEGCV